MSIPTYEHSFYLAFKVRQRGLGQLHARITERQPSLESGEVAVKVNVSLPRALFQRPQLQATIAIPPDKVAPTTIEASVLDNIAEVIKREIGVDMKITIGGDDA